MPTLDNAFFAFIGWLAGVVSPILVDLARERREKDQITKGLQAELDEVRIVSATSFYAIKGRLGLLTRADISWFNASLTGYHNSPEIAGTLRMLEVMLRLPEPQFETELQTLRNREEMGISIRRIEMPFLQSRIAELASFGPVIQRHLLDIARQARLFNEIADDARFYLRKTFESGLTNENHSRAVGNFDNNCIQIVERAKLIVDGIRSLPADWG